MLLEVQQVVMERQDRLVWLDVMVPLGNEGLMALPGHEVKREKKASVVQMGSTVEMLCAVLRVHWAQVP